MTERTRSIFEVKEELTADTITEVKVGKIL